MMSKEILNKLNSAREYVKTAIINSPEIGIVLGTGLSGITDMVDEVVKIPYKDIPHFPVSTVDTHTGRFICGNIFSKQVAILEGRVHLYEGYSAQDVCFGVRLLGLLGVKSLIITNAAGALNPLFQEGNIMVISDHINFQGTNPLIGPNIDEFGERFPDMSCVYDRELIQIALSAGLKLGYRLDMGVYVSVLGPSLETPAETRMLRIIGVDAVGMSTVMEVIAARHMGLKVLGLSCLTNKNLPDCMQETTFEYVVNQAKKAGKKLKNLIKEIIRTM